MSAPSDKLANIAELIDDGGQISIGQLHPILCAAVAIDDHDCYAMLRRRPDETLHQLLQRLDAAIATARDGGIRIEEINTAPSPSRWS